MATATSLHLQRDREARAPPHLTLDRDVSIEHVEEPAHEMEAEADTGVLRFRGRADNQVKLRGYRVELEEIDHALVACEGITRALAVVLHDATGASRLLAAYSGAKTADGDLRQHCAARLPAYMVPSRFVWLENIPVNANGKADRRSVASLLGEAVARAS